MAIKSITDVLRDALQKSAVPSKTLARETGIPHPSIMRFRRGEQTLYLDAADKLAAYFALELKPAAKRATKRKGK